MIPSFGRGRGRRPVLQLGNSNSNQSSYLARYGYQTLSEDAAGNDRRGKQNQETAGLSTLVGAYDDSDSEAEEPRADESNAPTPPHIPLPADMPQVKGQKDGQGQVIDTEVASFLAEINAISTDNPAVDHTDIPLPPGAFIPRDQTAEVMERNRMEVERNREQAIEEEVHPEPRPAKKTNNYSMFVKGGKERLGNKGGNYSQFVKGGTEVLKQQADKSGDRVEDEEFELPEAPTTVWQQCQDENTKYIYYWNFVSNEVTWNIPADYTQYLLLQKEYEDKLARIPEDIRKRLEAKKQAKSQAKETAVKANGSQQEKSKSPAPQPSSESSSVSSILQAPADRSDSPRLENSEAKPKKKSKKLYGPVLPDSQNISSSETVKEEKPEKKKLSVSEVDSFVSELLEVAPSGKAQKEESKPENGVALDQSDDIDFDIDDIDAALEMALERKTVELKKLDDDPKESKHKSKKHDKKDKRKDKHRSESHHKSESSRHRDKTESRSKSDSRHKRSSNRDEEKEVKKETTESQPKKARLVAAYDDDSEEEASTTTPVNTTTSASTSTSTSTSVTSAQPPESVPSSSRQEVNVKDYAKEEPKVRAVPHLIQIKDEVEDAASIALGKLEFLEVTKKGLSKLQVLLLELQTRFRDWQDGGLDTEFFLCRLKEANRQLEQYEQSAVPPGYSCHWDRYKRLFLNSPFIDTCKHAWTIQKPLRNAKAQTWPQLWQNWLYTLGQTVRRFYPLSSLRMDITLRLKLYSGP